MLFHRAGKYQQQSDCGRYSVCYWNIAGEKLYFAYRKGEPVVRLGQRATAEEARELCRKDAEVVV